MPGAGGTTSGIQAVARSAQILRLFSGAERLRVAEVATLLGLQRSTAHRYMVSLAGEGLLERDEDGSYGIGATLLQLGMRAVGAVQVVELAAPFMQRLAAEAAETVVLGLWAGHGPVVARVQEESTRLVRVSVRLGSALPLDSAQGQVFLALHADRATASRLLAQLPEHERRRLERQIEEVRGAGLAVNSRVVEGVRAIAVPVFDRDGTVCATLALVGTAASVPEDPASGIAQALRQTGRELSKVLGAPVDAGPDNALTLVPGTMAGTRGD